MGPDLKTVKNPSSKKAVVCRKHLELLNCHFLTTAPTLVEVAIKMKYENLFFYNNGGLIKKGSKI